MFNLWVSGLCFSGVMYATSWEWGLLSLLLSVLNLWAGLRGGK